MVTDDDRDPPPWKIVPLKPDEDEEIAGDQFGRVSRLAQEGLLEEPEFPLNIVGQGVLPDPS